MNNDHIKSCPFCGASANLHHIKDARGIIYTGVRCDGCFAHSAYFFNPRNAVEAWNSRAGSSNYYPFGQPNTVPP